jgi:hypothetical protein
MRKQQLQTGTIIDPTGRNHRCQFTNQIEEEWNTQNYVYCFT